MDVLDPSPSSDAPSDSVADRVTDRLRESIQLGRYAAGTRLVERSLAEQFNVSHIPVREALARLSEEGLVQRLPRRRARVAGLSPDLFDKVSEVRVLLERFVARRAHELMTPADRATLEAIVEAMVTAAGTGDADRVLELDRRFHEQLVAVADHVILSELVAQLRGRVNAFLQAATSSLSGRRLIAHAESHRRLLMAIADGPPSRRARGREAHPRGRAPRLSRLQPRMTAVTVHPDVAAAPRLVPAPYWMHDAEWFGVYGESAWQLPVALPDGRAAVYSPFLILGSDGAVATGRERYGQPKKGGEVSLEARGDLVVGVVARNGIDIATATATIVYKQRRAAPRALDDVVAGAAVNVNLRILPDGQGGMRRELVTRAFTDVVTAEEWTGPAALELRPNAQAPVHLLPVGDIVLGLHRMMDLTLGPDAVIHTY